MDSNQPPIDARRTDGIGRFFLWCAGADRSLLAGVPRSETTKQIGFGTLVLIPAVLALFAMSYALSTLSDSRWVFLGGGAAWSLVVFCFDRFIVSTFRKSASVVDDLSSLVFVSRLVFAVFVGMIVAHPLVLLYFNDTIEERLAADGRAKVAALGAEVEARERAVLARVAALESEVRQRERERNDYQARLVDEIDGVVSGRTSGIPGRGSSAAEKKRQLERAQAELEALRERNRSEISGLQARIDDLRREGAAERARFEQPRDYLARAGALAALSAEHPHVDRVKWFLILFFVFVDTLPILFKGLSPRGPYDARLELAERQAERSVDADRESFERVLYPHLVLSRENGFVADRGYRGVDTYPARYRAFLAQMTRHQEEFLAEWRRQQQVLSRLEDEELRASQAAYMEKLRAASADVVDRAVERFSSALAWESGRDEPSAEPG